GDRSTSIDPRLGVTHMSPPSSWEYPTTNPACHGAIFLCGSLGRGNSLVFPVCGSKVTASPSSSEPRVSHTWPSSLSTGPSVTPSISVWNSDPSPSNPTTESPERNSTVSPTL